jgi:hypothetical protein
MASESITDQINVMPAAEITPIAEQTLGGLKIDGKILWQARSIEVTSKGNGTVGL